MPRIYEEKWKEDVILARIQELVDFTGQKTMPTHSEMYDYFGNHSLAKAISERKGTNYYADKLGLKLKNCESNLGFKMEMFCIEEIENILGIECEKTKSRHPYDIIVGRCVKVDVKCARIFNNYGNSKYYTFNLEKNHQTCDIYVFYCMDENENISKTLIIPSAVLSGKTQFAIAKESKYDKYKDAWYFIQDYYDFIEKSKIFPI